MRCQQSPFLRLKVAAVGEVSTVLGIQAQIFCSCKAEYPTIKCVCKEKMEVADGVNVMQVPSQKGQPRMLDARGERKLLRPIHVFKDEENSG